MSKCRVKYSEKSNGRYFIQVTPMVVAVFVIVIIALECHGAVPVSLWSFRSCCSTLPSISRGNTIRRGIAYLSLIGNGNLYERDWKCRTIPQNCITTQFHPENVMPVGIKFKNTKKLVQVYNFLILIPKNFPRTHLAAVAVFDCVLAAQSRMRLT